MQTKFLLLFMLFSAVFSSAVFGQKTDFQTDREKIRRMLVEKLKSAPEQFELAEFEVFFQGDAALVSYSAQNRKKQVERQYGLDVFAKQNGRWTSVSSNSARRSTDLIAVSPEARKIILQERENVWRAWFANDETALKKAIPEEIVTISTGQSNLEYFAEVFSGAERFVKRGSKLVRLEYPKDDIQVYGSTIIIYTLFLFEVETGGVKQTTQGRATDMFLIRDGNFFNVGWHLDSGK